MSVYDINEFPYFMQWSRPGLNFGTVYCNLKVNHNLKTGQPVS
jgi:hypothetical protein